MRKLLEFLKVTTANGWYWLLDYIYVAYWQFLSIFVRTNPGIYRFEKETNKGTIILIPGVYERWFFMKPLAEFLYKHGYDIHVIESLKYNTGDVEAMAAIVNEYLEKNSITNCSIVAHSKGGLIGKYLLANFNQKNNIKRLIALNTPFSGSRYAYLMPVKTISIFKPNSPVVSLLAANKEVNKMIVSIYGLFDPRIPAGSYLEGAENIQLPTRGHFRIMNDQKIREAVLTNLAKSKHRP